MIYDEIFNNKFLKKNNKYILINKKYFYQLKIKNNLKEKKINIIQSTDITEDILKHKFDLIIVIELFSLYYDDIIDNIINNIKNILNTEGKILFVERLIIKDIFKPISDLKKILFSYCSHIFQKDILMSDLYDILRDNEFKIIDVNRILSIDDYNIYDTDYYTILCRL